MRRAGILVLAAVGLLVPAGGIASPASAGVDPPNIVFVLTDDQSLEALSIGLPYLDSEPGGHWVRFENTFISTPLCCPSRATMLTGQYSHNHGVIDNDAGARLDESSTVATWLDAAGYRTGLVGKYLNHYPFPRRGPVVPPGWDAWAAFRGKVAYVDFDVVHGEEVVTSNPKGYSTDVITDHAERFIEDSAGDPFFLYLAYKAPHFPWTPAARHDGAFEDLPIGTPPNFNEIDVSDKPRWVQDLPLLNNKRTKELAQNRRREYETLLAVDDGIQRIYDTLDAQGALDNTVIVFMTDNGFSFGEHRHIGKVCAYEECAATPLLVRYPDGPAGTRTIDSLVSSVDIAPTFADLAGATPTIPVDGMSLVPLLDGDDPASREGLLLEWRRASYKAVPAYHVVRTETHKWVEYDNGERELYDLVTDPYELENLAGTEPVLEADLHALLVELLGS